MLIFRYETSMPTTLLLARAEREANRYYPLDTENGSDLFDILSGPHIASGLRKRVGEFLYDRGFFATPEFRRAEERMELWPASAWHKVQVTPEGCHETLSVRYRDPMVCMADTFRNPQLNPKEDCVWGPEVLKDVLTEDDDPFGRGYISEVFHGEWCAKKPKNPRRAAEPSGYTHMHKRKYCYFTTGAYYIQYYCNLLTISVIFTENTVMTHIKRYLLL